MLEVSVVLPVYNGARSIGRAVRSILDQTLRQIELIVVDDGSTDDTAAVVQGFRDPRLRLIRGPRRNVSAAANLGTEQARAALIARMDADDFAHPQRLEKQRALLERCRLDAVGCQVHIADESGRAVTTMRRYAQWINEETICSEQIAALRFVELPLVNPTILARRSYFELGFRHGDFPEDYDLMLRAAAAGMRIGKVAEVLLDWTRGPASLTHTDTRYAPAAFDRCRRMHLLAGPLWGVRCVDLWGVGRTGKPWLRWLQSQGIEVRCGFDVNPRKLGQRIHGLRVAHPAQMPTADGTTLIIAVGAAGSRQLIGPQLRARGYAPGADAWFVA